MLLWDRRYGAVGVAWGRWAVYVCVGRPVWWAPRWVREELDWCDHWCAGWLLVAAGALRYRRGARWPTLRRAGQARAA